LAGASTTVANAGQAVALLIGAGAVWTAFRGPFNPRHRLVVLLCAITLSAPHLGDYDAILLGIAAMFVLTSSAGAFGMGAQALAAAAWCSTAINPPHLFQHAIPILFPIAELTPLVMLALLLRLTMTPAASRPAAAPAC
jgi:hypothetical protein